MFQTGNARKSNFRFAVFRLWLYFLGMRPRYTKLEERFDELTPDWVVSTSRAAIETGGADGVLPWAGVVPFKGCSVRKGTPVVGENGQTTWRFMQTKTAFPDFVVMSERQYAVYSAMLERAKNGRACDDPFRCLGCMSGFYIELLGDYFHSGDFVQGLSREQHEAEVTRAYESAGARVLLLWEGDVNERWEEVCVPKLMVFLEQAAQRLELPAWDKVPASSKGLSAGTLSSLHSAAFWRGLSAERQIAVVDELCEGYARIDFPFPDREMALRDYRRFVAWAKRKSGQTSRFGSVACRHFVRSIVDARVKGKPSMREVWNNQTTMREAIEWQLANENGQHHAERFLNAMCFRTRFRVVSNLHPSRVVHWLRKYAIPTVGGVFFDPCAGWGGRQLAASVLGMRYRAIDANPKLVQELNDMASELEIDGRVVHGRAETEASVQKAMQGEKASVVLTSPPFFDLEDYGPHPEQSIVGFPDRIQWIDGFLVPMIRNAMSVLESGGVAIFHVPKELDLERLRSSLPWQIEEVFEANRGAVGVRQERLLVLKPQALGAGREPIDFVVCRLCKRRFRVLQTHLARVHSVSKEQYAASFPGAPLFCETTKRRVGDANTRKPKRKNRQRVVYRCPDGRLVKKIDAWRRAWNGEGPQDSVLDASDVNLDRWRGKIEGVDYVRCTVCGHKGRNILRHVKSVHGLAGYEGQLRCIGFEEAVKAASKKTWDKRGRKPKVCERLKKTHKLPDLDRSMLVSLYCAEGLSDAAIGARMGVTGEAIAYRRKKWGIQTRKR